MDRRRIRVMTGTRGPTFVLRALVLVLVLFCVTAVVVLAPGTSSAGGCDPALSGQSCYRMPPSNPRSYLQQGRLAQMMVETPTLTARERAVGLEYYTYGECSLFGGQGQDCKGVRGPCEAEHVGGTDDMVYSRPIGAETQWYTRGVPKCVVAGPPSVTPADVRRVVQRRRGQLVLAVKADPLRMQPPYHKALALRPVIFYLPKAPVIAPFVVTVNQQQVRIAPYPAFYTWHFEPGQAVTTTDSGQPYPDEDPALAYQYGHLGTVHPYVTIHWRATFTVAGGPPQQAYPPPTALPINGDPQPMLLLNQRSVLVGPGG